ncbi:hypothetical protein cyc_07566 [Cyclospora cayetanensis]|uniref:Uncharacterized protein n=1 Tax=Cyclospora cayetanensis TaxID=88456 RepID=A0A1D3D2H6_9EIME|nr:hypothetical protein cyc_07566 [Cyclospora cayetanensis]
MLESTSCSPLSPAVLPSAEETLDPVGKQIFSAVHEGTGGSGGAYSSLPLQEEASFAHVVARREPGCNVHSVKGEAEAAGVGPTLSPPLPVQQRSRFSIGGLKNAFFWSSVGSVRHTSMEHL